MRVDRKKRQEKVSHWRGKGRRRDGRLSRCFPPEQPTAERRRTNPDVTAAGTAQPGHVARDKKKTCAAPAVQCTVHHPWTSPILPGREEGRRDARHETPQLIVSKGIRTLSIPKLKCGPKDRAHHARGQKMDVVNGRGPGSTLVGRVEGQTKQKGGR